MARPPKKQTGGRFFSPLTAGLYREIKRWWDFLGKRFTLLPLGRSALQITRRGSRTSLAGRVMGQTPPLALRGSRSVIYLVSFASAGLIWPDTGCVYHVARASAASDKGA